MSGNVPALLPGAFAWPFPPGAIGWVSLALVLTAATVALARVHSVSGAVVAAALATLVTPACACGFAGSATSPHVPIQDGRKRLA